MEISKKIKNIIFKYLLKDISKVEIIYYRDSVWFIDRENRYWYFEYHKVDKHLWWRWSHFTSTLNMFSMEAEENQSIFGELINMILIKKQKLELKYPNKIFKTVGSVMNFEDNDEVGLKNEVKTTQDLNIRQLKRVDEVLNCEVKTTVGATDYTTPSIDEILGSETKIKSGELIEEHEIMDKVLEIEKIDFAKGSEVYEIERALNSISSAENGADHIMDFILTDGAFYNDEIVTNEVLNFEVEKIHEHRSTKGILVKDILEYSTETIGHEVFTDTLYKEDIDEVLTQSPKLIEKQYDIDVVIDNTIEIETIDYSKTHRLRPVTGALDYNVETTESVKGNLKYEVRDVLESTIEINSIEKLKGENPFQDIVVGHILDESDKVTDKLKMKEDDYVKTFSHDVYMCDHLVQNVLDIGVNSIHYDAEPHTQLVDGILKKSYNL